MGMRSEIPARLILLVGSNPLPNYLSACALRPHRVALVYTTETVTAKDRLKVELDLALGGRAAFVDPDPLVEDATCATTVQRTLDDLARSSGGDIDQLNYTGGTKVMAAHARMAFMQNGGRPECASYLDEGGEGGQPRLRFDDGTSKELSLLPDVSLDLRAILALHGITHKPRTLRDPAPTREDAEKILLAVLRDVSVAEKLYMERKRLEGLGKPLAANTKPFDANAFGLDMSTPNIPDSACMNRKAYEQWYKFIGGEWLEHWLGQQIEELGLEPTPEIVVGVNASRGTQRANLEVDVAVVRGHRSYFISCTADTTKSICKSKLFEVAVRSRHLGGDLARAALLCLADDRTVAALQADIDDLWGASNTTRVFGISDVRSWSRCDGKKPNRYSLKTWLEN